ncbi:MAG TPA: transporter [Bacteroidia bacterium]|nr:transporter [Bacteroidia bacterium]
MRKLRTFLILLFILNYTKSHSQGCSDAGFCTMGALGPMVSEDTLASTFINLNAGFASGEQKTKHTILSLELGLALIKDNIIQIKLPYHMVNGDLGSNYGVGDMTISTTHTLSRSERSSFSASLGLKLPTGTTDYIENGISLAMPYQTGLGTTDLILGTSYQYQKWRISAGYQMVLNNKNENRYLKSNGTEDFEKAYFDSNLLNRGDDALLRIERAFDVKKLKIMIGLLSIYRLQEDEISNLNSQTIKLDGSDGITLNATFGLQYPISSKMELGIVYGSPLVVRDTRADGLTRSFVGTGSLKYIFGK